jgi:hypothetical protein
VSNLLFFRRSFAYRNAAAEMMRKAREMPLGPERRAARQLARALKDLAKTEAWLEGQTPRLRATTDNQERARSAARWPAARGQNFVSKISLPMISSLLERRCCPKNAPRFDHISASLEPNYCRIGKRDDRKLPIL